MKFLIPFLSMKNPNSILSLLLVLFVCLQLPSYGFAKSNSETSNSKSNVNNNKSKKSNETNKRSERKKSEKTPKNPREVRTSVLPRSKNPILPPQVPPRVSMGTALGLGKHSDILNLKSNAALVVDQNSQEVLFEKNAHTVLPIASITKIMTAMTVLDSHLNLDEVLRINEEDAAIYNHSRLIKGTELTRREALLLALMSSENRAAYTLGRNYPGGIDDFMMALNRKAKEIGMKSSRFEDPTGLTSKNVASPEDLVIMVNAAYQYPMIREFSTTMNHSKLINNRMQEFISSNRLVRSGNMQIGLQKTGYISEAGRCLVMQATVNSKPYIMVFLDSEGSQSRFADAVRVKDWLESQTNSEMKGLRHLVFKSPSPDHAINTNINPNNLMPNMSNPNNLTGNSSMDPLKNSSLNQQTIESILLNR